MKIRAATIEGADEVADVYIGSRRRHVAFAPLAHSDDEIRGWVRQVLIPKSSVLVIEEARRIVAMMSTSQSANGSWIEQLYVHPDMTSSGFGAALVAEAKKALPPPIQSYTFQQNLRSRSFYERLGFVAVEFTDGSGNEERCPDALYCWEKTPNQTPAPKSVLAPGRGPS